MTPVKPCLIVVGKHQFDMADHIAQELGWINVVRAIKVGVDSHIHKQGYMRVISND